MLSVLNQQDRFDRLMARLRLAAAVTPELMSDIVAGACVRFQVFRRLGKTARLEKLIAAAAWSDAALALIEIELPAWTLRRLVYDDGEWFCSLSKQPNLPIEFDDTADARHGMLPLAILGALIEARRRGDVARDTDPPTVAQARLPNTAFCCDDFA